MARSASNVAASRSPVWDALKPSPTVKLTLLLSSGLINILTLTGSLFMMQVYDRVLGSQSVETLIALSLIALFAYVMQGILDGYRGRILVLLAEKFDAEIAPRVNAANLQLTLRSANGAAEAQRNSRHVEAIRSFVGGPGPVAACDLPWLPIYLFVAFIIHWSLAVVIVVASLFFMWLTFMTNRASAAPGREALEAGVRRAQESDSVLRSAEVVQSMGMRKAMSERWRALNDKYLFAQRNVTNSVSGYIIASKTSRMLLQSLMLALGALLAIKGQISAGAIIAASIMSTRALAPIDQAIGSWKPYLAARDGYRALNDLLRRAGVEPEPFELQPPKASLVVTDLAVAIPPMLPPMGQPMPAGGPPERIALQGIRMTVKAGEIVCVMGPSASGKSTLGRALVGVWRPRAGSVKLDDAPIEQWSPDRLGLHVGYLPQDVQLFDGTIAENISRFHPEATDAKVFAAATAAEFDKHVLAFGGFDRRIGPGGAHLSAGQRQRLGLARALYGDPFLVVLDEPNSNLDSEGEAALQTALDRLKARGGVGVVIAHNLKVLEVADLILYLDKGAAVTFGPRDRVLQELKMDALIPKLRPQAKPEPQPAPAAASASPAHEAPQAEPTPARAKTFPAMFQSPRLVMQRGGDKGAK